MGLGTPASASPHPRRSRSRILGLFARRYKLHRSRARKETLTPEAVRRLAREFSGEKRRHRHVNALKRIPMRPKHERPFVGFPLREPKKAVSIVIYAPPEQSGLLRKQGVRKLLRPKRSQFTPNSSEGLAHRAKFLPQLGVERILHSDN